MRTLKESILSTTKVGKYDEWNTFKKEHAHPTNKNELRGIIDKSMEFKGPNVNLNWIDTSELYDMYSLFYRSKFNGDISKWDVSKVKNMQGMFYGSKFNGDISEWNVSNVKDISYMFYMSDFNGDISKWNVKKVKDMSNMFVDSPLENNPPKWYKGVKR